MKIDNKQQNSKYRLGRKRDETVNYIINECSKIAQKEYNTLHDWVGKVIHLELRKRLKFDHTTKCYIHKTEFIQVNETHRIPWLFRDTNRSPRTRKERTLHLVDFAILADLRVKIKESEKIKK